MVRKKTHPERRFGRPMSENGTLGISHGHNFHRENHDNMCRDTECHVDR